MIKSKDGYSSISLKQETAKELRGLYAAHGKGMTFMGFIEKLGKFFDEYHCRECNVCLAKKEKHHVCG